MYIHTYISTHTHVCTHTHMCVNMHVHMYVHIHIQTFMFAFKLEHIIENLLYLNYLLKIQRLQTAIKIMKD